MTRPHAFAGDGRTGDTRGALVLVVAHDLTVAAPVIDMLEGAGYGVLHATRGLDALLAVEDDPPAAIILDWCMPLIDGPVFMDILASPYTAIGLPNVPPVIALVGDEQDVQEARRAGVHVTLPRGPRAEVLLSAVRLLHGRSSLAL